MGKASFFVMQELSLRGALKRIGIPMRGKMAEARFCLRLRREDENRRITYHLVYGFHR